MTVNTVEGITFNGEQKQLFFDGCEHMCTLPDGRLVRVQSSKG